MADQVTVERYDLEKRAWVRVSICRSAEEATAYIARMQVQNGGGDQYRTS